MQLLKIQADIKYRLLFTFMLSGIMSACMTYLISTGYGLLNIKIFVNTWASAWLNAFIIIFILSPFLQKFTKFILK